MEKVESFRKTIQGNDRYNDFTIISYEDRFTTEEKIAFHKALNKYEQPLVTKFINWLEFHCQDMTRFLDRPTGSNHVSDLNQAIRTLQHSAEYLSNMRMGKIYFSPGYKDLNELNHLRYSPPEDKDNSPLLDLINKSNTAFQAVMDLIEFLKKEKEALKQNKGRSKADSSKFVYRIAEEYSRIFEKPSFYEDGPFFSVVRIALEAVGLPSVDPSRTVRSALKSFKEVAVPDKTPLE